MIVPVPSLGAGENGDWFTVTKYHSEKAVTADGWRYSSIQLMPVNPAFERIAFKRAGVTLFQRSSAHESFLSPQARHEILKEKIELMLERELQHRRIVTAGGVYAAMLIGWVEVVGAAAH